MGPVEALQMALSKEEEALALYRRMALEHAAVTDIFNVLVVEEEKHRKMIQERIAAITRG